MANEVLIQEIDKTPEQTAYKIKASLEFGTSPSGRPLMIEVKLLDRYETPKEAFLSALVALEKEIQVRKFNA